MINFMFFFIYVIHIATQRVYMYINLYMKIKILLKIKIILYIRNVKSQILVHALLSEKATVKLLNYIK